MLFKVISLSIKTLLLLKKDAEHVLLLKEITLNNI